VDLYKAIRDLVEERNRIDKIIASLEEMLARGNSQASTKKDRRPAKRRGRKNMSPEERKVVSERMARYWAARRAAKDQELVEQAPQSEDAATS
jgi:hypothetical protein